MTVPDQIMLRLAEWLVRADRPEASAITVVGCSVDEEHLRLDVAYRIEDQRVTWTSSFDLNATTGEIGQRDEYRDDPEPCVRCEDEGPCWPCRREAAARYEGEARYG